MKNAELEAKSIYRTRTDMNAAKEMKDILKKAWFKPRRGGWRKREARDSTVEVGEGQTETQKGLRRWRRKRERPLTEIQKTNNVRSNRNIGYVKLLHWSA